MPPKQNRQVILNSRPVGIPQSEHFRIVDAPLPELKPGELLVRNDFLSVDPAMRGWVNAAANYSDPVAVGEVMRSFAAGHVDCFAPSGVRGERSRDGHARLAGIRGDRRQVPSAARWASPTSRCRCRSACSASTA